MPGLGRATSLTAACAVLVSLVASLVAAPAEGRSSGSAEPAVADPIPTPEGPAGTSRRKVLVIGLDGAGLDRIRRADTPHLDRLMRDGTTSDSLLYGPAPEGLTQEARTVSGPGWTTVLTGVWPDKHGVRDNTFAGARREAWPDFLTRAERARPSLSTFAVADWEPLVTEDLGGPVVSDEVDVRVGIPTRTEGGDYRTNDARVADVAARYLRSRGPDLSFVYLGQVDEAGHAAGSASRRYRRALEAVDAEVGRLLRAIRQRPTYDRERWQILVTNDHGHLATGGHGGNAPMERQQLVIASGSGVERGVRRDDLAFTDVAATALEHVGVARPAGLDGTPVDLLRRDAFDRRRGLVADRGWTRRMPKGWSVDNDRMPARGVAAWRGWTLTDQRTWSAAQRSQGRENFVRGRGVVAVADSDEWEDAEHGPGRFDSTLVSREFPVGGRSARVSFQHFYQHEGAQVAQVSAVFDTGQRVRVATYDTNSYGRQVERIAVPAGATSLRLRFRYAGHNNWYWAIDDVRVG